MVDKKNMSRLKTFGDIIPVLEKEINNSIDNGSSGGLLYVSIDNFPMIISSLSREYSEELLDGIIAKIAMEFKDSAVLVRSGKGKINIVLRNTSPEEVQQKSNQIHRMIQDYGCLDSLEPIHVMASVGSVDFPGTASDALDAIDKAYIALNDAKDVYRHCTAYKDPKKHEVESRNQMILANYMQDAFLHNKMRLAFQPIINTKTREVDYYESLLRIINDDGTTSSAGPFIPIAEKMGFIDEIDVMVFKLVIDELRKSPDLKLSVNLSNASMNDSKWLKSAMELLVDPDIASRLIVEITETAEVVDIHIVSRLVSIIQDLGCQVALDDFGTGYTSFLQLKSLPVDIIKIDGSFVRDIVTNPQSRFFVKTLMEFSKNFNLKSVAEFVEDKETADILESMGVDYLQGNYFSPAVNYRDWMNEDENTA